MDYYENKDNVAKYIQFTPSHDGAFLVDLLVEHLPADSHVLEIGIGPGWDFDRLSEHFRMTGSDVSNEFLQRYRKKNGEADIVQLDARTLEIDRTFDGIYSNKALIHMGHDELAASFARQHAVLNESGLILHSFWRGTGEEEYNQLRLVFHEEQELTRMLEPAFEILEIGRHAKMADDDSVYVLARKTS